MDNQNQTGTNADDDKMEGAQARKVQAKRSKKAIEKLNTQLRYLKTGGTYRFKPSAPMGHVAAERDLNHDDEDEPQQVQCIEVDDEDEECSTSNDPPQLQRPSSTETSAFKVSTKSSDCTLSAEAKPALQPQKYYLDLPPATELSEFIESRVNGILKGEGVQHVCVREVHCQPMLFTPSSEFQDFLKEYIPKEIIYTQRSLMCFQMTATGWVMFFYLCVQEYDKSCPPPYQNTAYIAMIDSVRHFEPSNKRTNVYNCILLSYLQNLRISGFKNAFLWACPPKPEEEYVFNQRPKSQLTPTEPMLIEWYSSLMKVGVELDVLKSYSTLYDWCPKTVKEFLSTFPCYPGDHWLEQMYETIKSLDKLRLNENNEVILAATKKKSSPSKGKSVCVAVNKYEYVFKEVLHELKVYKKTFFCMTLNDDVVPKAIPEIVIPNAFASSRDKILNFQKEQDLTVSDLHNAAHTTKLFVVRLNMSWYNFCVICRKTFTTNGVRCKVCDQNFCEACNRFTPHHDHKSWMRIVPWNGKETNANYGPDDRRPLSSKFDMTEFNDEVEKIRNGDAELNSNFLQLVSHMEICQNRKKCIVCRAICKKYLKV